MKHDFLTNPVITGNFNPKFFWTANFFTDSERINRPFIKKYGENENRIQDTIDILNELKGKNTFTIQDAINIQNQLLQKNDWRKVVELSKNGLRTHNVSDIQPHFNLVESLTNDLFPVAVMDKDHLLQWYKQIILIHPLSDLNEQVFGIIISVLNEIRVNKSY